MDRRLIIPIIFFGVTLLVGLLLIPQKLWSRPLRWVVYYGSDLAPAGLHRIDFAILEPGNINPGSWPVRPVSTRLIGYLSLGEVHRSRAYWSQLQEKGCLLQENPRWPGAFAMDIRCETWRRIILEELIPQMVSQGYQGLFLDTVDVPLEQERADPEHFSGAREALIQLVVQMHMRYPDLEIYPNNALELLDDSVWASAISGVVVEDLYTRYDFEASHVVSTPTKVMSQKEVLLDRFKVRWRKNVMVILYGDGPAVSESSPVARFAISRARQKRYNWYFTTVDLMSLGITAH